MKDEELLNFYFYGWELCSDDAKFPDWFEFGYEKIACLQGFNDFEMQISRNKEEIISTIRRILK